MRPVVRAHPTVVGIFHYGSRHNSVKPIDSKITMEIVKFRRARKIPWSAGEHAGKLQRKSVDRVLGDEAGTWNGVG